MDILVIPHRVSEMYSQGFPSKIIGYMWAGNAIIATRVGELSNLLEDGKTAMLIEPDNEAVLARAIMELVVDDKKRKQLGANARKYYEKNLAEEAIKPKVTQFLQGVVSATQL